MTEHKGRTSVCLYEEKEFLETSIEKSNSKYIRELIKRDRQLSSSEEAQEFKIHKLERDIEQLRRKAQNRIEEGLDALAEAEELEERLEQIKNNDLLPQDREAVEEYLEEMDGEGQGYLNPHNYHVEDCAESATLSKKELIKEGVKRADSVPNLDTQVNRIRENSNEINEQNIHNVGYEAGIHDIKIDDDFLVELAKIRDDVLSDNEGQEANATEVNAVGDS